MLKLHLFDTVFLPVEEEDQHQINAIYQAPFDVIYSEATRGPLLQA
ncbi:hypothetical protein [Klugiella xanthotipulae]|nr:hypothetical protein [Klugiella xanthotipulae]